MKGQRSESEITNEKTKVKGKVIDRTVDRDQIGVENQME